MADAFIYRIDGNSDTYYALATPQNTMNIALLTGQTIVADSTMVYRLYIVWGRSLRVVLLPLILVIGLIGADCGVVLSTIRWQTPLHVSPGYFGTIVSFFGATLILNLAVSGLITYRIWSINRDIAGLTGHKTYSIVYILVENAVLYVACVGSTLIGFTLDDAYQFIVRDA
ncbi:hypothetical protein BD779DRAFT_1522749, partial [Infundibulicybe gibba]